MTHRVLIAIVDDNRHVRERLRDLVQSLGYTAASFASAADYLVSGLVPQTTCLITDLQMPEMTGADLQDLLIAHGLDIPVIFVTANREEALSARALSTVAIGILGKPFDEQWLRGSIAEALRQRREALDEALGVVRQPEARAAA